VNNVKTARSFDPQANSRPGVQSGLCPLSLSASNDLQGSNVIRIFFRLAGSVTYNDVILSRWLSMRFFAQKNSILNLRHRPAHSPREGLLLLSWHKSNQTRPKGAHEHLKKINNRWITSRLPDPSTHRPAPGPACSQASAHFCSCT